MDAHSLQLGGKCGSTYIDREFIKWMENKFGNAYTSLSLIKKGPASRFMKDFESHKRDFGKTKDPTRYYEMYVQRWINACLELETLMHLLPNLCLPFRPNAEFETVELSLALYTFS